MYGEVLETREGISRNRGTERDIQASRAVVEWMQTPAGKESSKEVGEFVFRMFHDSVCAPQDRGNGVMWSPL
jgi:hypothetical protein